MSQNVKFGIEVGLDTKDAQTNVARFEAEFRRMLEGLGKTPDEIRAFQEVRKAADAGKLATQSLDAATRGLLDQYRELRAQAVSRDILEMIPHEELKRRIDTVKAAFETLKASGKLSQTELAQASLKATEQIRELEKQTTGWTDALAKAKLGLAGMAGAGAGLGYMVKQAVDFESAMADVKKVVEASPEEFAALTDEIRGLTRELPLSAKELANIAAAGGQLGVANKDLGEFTRLAAEMSTAFTMTADQAGTAVAKLSNVFGIPIPQIRGLGDAINVLGNTTSATEAQIIDATVRSGGMAKQFGLAADQTAALAAAFISLGKQPEVAATGINALLSRLQTARVGSVEFKQGLDMIGVSADELAAKVAAKPQQALLEFLHTLETLDKQSRAEALTKLFGQEYQDDISALVGNLKVYEQTLGSVTDKSKVAGSMANEFGERMKTAEAQVALLKNALQDVALSVGAALLPALKSAVDGVKPLAEGIADFAKAHPDIAAIGTTLGIVATSVGTLEIALKALRLAGVSSFEQITTTLKTSVRELDGLRTGIGVLQAAFVGWEVGTLLSEKFAVVRRAGVLMTEGLVKGAEAVRYAWDLAAAAFNSDTIDAATKRHEARLREMNATFADLYREAEKGAQKVAVATAQAGQAAGAAGKAAEEGGRKAQEVGKKTTAILKEQREEAAALEEAFRYFGPVAEKAFTGVSGQAKESASRFADLIQGIRENGATAAQVASVFDSVWPEAIAKATNTTDLDYLAETLKDLRDAGDLTAEQLDKGLGLVARRMGDIAAGGPSVVDWIKRIHETAERGYAAEREQAQRLANEQAKAYGATDSVFDQLQEKARQGKDAWGELQDGISQAHAGVREFSASLSEAFPALAKASQEAKDEFARLLEEANRAAVDAGRDYSFLGDRIASVESLARGVTDEFTRQAQAAAQLTARIQDGTLSVREGQIQADEAAQAFKLLGKEQLLSLRQALADARARSIALEDSARSTLSALQDELDQLNNNQIAIENRRYAQQQADLQAQLDAAQKAKDSKAVQDLRNAERIADQIHEKKLSQIQAEAAAQKAQTAADEQAALDQRKAEMLQREGISSPTASSLAREAEIAQANAYNASLRAEPSASRTVRIEFGGGIAGSFDESSADQLIKLLQSKGLSSAVY